jgi:hypothetical protein
MSNAEQRLTNPFMARIDAVGQRGAFTFACRGGRSEALPGGALCGPLFALDGRRPRRRAALDERAVLAL